MRQVRSQENLRRWADWWVLSKRRRGSRPSAVSAGPCPWTQRPASRRTVSLLFLFDPLTAERAYVSLSNRMLASTVLIVQSYWKACGIFHPTTRNSTAQHLTFLRVWEVFVPLFPPLLFFSSLFSEHKHSTFPCGRTTACSLTTCSGARAAELPCRMLTHPY